MRHGVSGNTTDFGSVIHGSSPCDATIEWIDMGRKKKPRIINSLDDILPGDRVYYTNRFQRGILTAVRVTATMIVCDGGLRFKRSTGAAIPLEPYNLAKIQVLTKELEEAHEIGVRKRKLITSISSVDWQSLSVEALEQIQSCIDNDNLESV